MQVPAWERRTARVRYDGNDKGGRKRLMRLDQKPTSRKMTPIAQPPSMNERTSPGMRSGFSGT